MSVPLQKEDYIMFIVGVDIAKRAHEAIIIDDKDAAVQKKVHH